MNKKPAVNKGTLYNMCCLVSNKTVYAEEEQPAVEGVEAKKDATDGDDDNHESSLPAADKDVKQTSGSLSYSHSSLGSADVPPMPKKDPKEPLKDNPETSLAKDSTPMVQPMQNKDGSVSKPPSPEVSQKVKKIVEKHGYCAVDSPKKVPMTNDELRADYEWYKLDNVKDKDLGFIDMVNRHASSLTLT